MAILIGMGRVVLDMQGVWASSATVGTNNYGGYLVGDYRVEQTDAERPRSNARSQGRDRSITGSERIDGVGHVAGYWQCPRWLKRP